MRLQTVGAPDPERRTSPIVDEVLAVDVEPETRVCYFNDATFAPGEDVYGDAVAFIPEINPERFNQAMRRRRPRP